MNRQRLYNGRPYKIDMIKFILSKQPTISVATLHALKVDVVHDMYVDAQNGVVIDLKKYRKYTRKNAKKRL